MKKLLSVLSLAVVFTACKKNSVHAPTPQANSELKLVKAVYNDKPEFYYYDAQNRIKKYDYPIGIMDFEFVSPTELVITKTKKSDNTTNKMRCTLNASGAITKIISEDAQGNPVWVEEYGYDADGYMITEKGSNADGSNNSLAVYTIENGNQVSAKAYFDGVHLRNRYYTYDLTRLNKNKFPISWHFLSDRLFGKPYKNVLIGYRQEDVNGNINWQNTNQVEFDNAGYVKSYIKKFLVPSAPDAVAEFFYQ